MVLWVRADHLSRALQIQAPKRDIHPIGLKATDFGRLGLKLSMQPGETEAVCRMQQRTGRKTWNGPKRDCRKRIIVTTCCSDNYIRKSRYWRNLERNSVCSGSSLSSAKAWHKQCNSALNFASIQSSGVNSDMTASFSHTRFSSINIRS